MMMMVMLLFCELRRYAVVAVIRVALFLSSLELPLYANFSFFHLPNAIFIHHRP